MYFIVLKIVQRQMLCCIVVYVKIQGLCQYVPAITSSLTSLLVLNNSEKVFSKVCRRHSLFTYYILICDFYDDM